MTLSRPAWRATLTNHTRGWSYETYEGEPFDKTDPVRLLDDWVTDWQHKDADTWSHLDPTVVTAAVGVRDRKNLPPTEYDDEMSLHVVRPRAVGDPTVWFHAFGSVSDLDADADWQRGTALKITFVDPRAILNARPVPLGVKVDNAVFNDAIGLGYIRAWGTADGVDLWGTSWSSAFEESTSCADVIDMNANSIAATPKQWWTSRYAHRVSSLPTKPDWGLFGPAASPYRYYFERWPVPELAAGDAMPALIDLGIVDGMLTAEGFMRTATPGPMTVIDAKGVLSPVPWKKDARGGRVVVDATGFDNVTKEPINLLVGPAPTADKTTTVPLPTILRTTLDLAGAHRLALQQEQSSVWRTPSLTIDTRRLTDAQVDYLAGGRLYPREFPDDIGVGMRPVVIVGAAEQGHLAGAVIIGMPVGAKFRISRGRLLIDLELAPWLINAGTNPANIPGPTYAALNAAFGAIDYAHVDPDLTFDDLKLASV